MKSFYLTDAGKVRNHNEDSVIIVKNDEDSYLMAIADGMGGHSAGEVASSIAIGHLGKYFKESLFDIFEKYPHNLSTGRKTFYYHHGILRTAV